jgi:ABC-type lipoprotein export system ATPase subunit
MLEIMSKLRRMADAGKVILLISHNKKSLSFCDKIIPLNE